MRLRLPHPLLLLFGAVVVAAALTWLLPTGEFDRRDDPVTNRKVVVAGTYHSVRATPVGPFAAAVSIPRGIVDGAEVIALILIAGGTWAVLDRLGTLGRVVAALVTRFRDRGLMAIPIVSLFFIAMGALENMQEEIIPLIPVLLVLGRGLGVDALTVVAMSAGAAMIGSAFGPTNPFQAAIASKLAQLPTGTALGLRTVLLVVASFIWIAWTMRHAIRTRTVVDGTDTPAEGDASSRDVLILLIAVAPVAVYVYGSLHFDWGFNELSAGFLIAGLTAGVLGGLRGEGTARAMLDGMQGLVPAAILVGVARSISLVLTDGHVIDTILQHLATPLMSMPAIVAALLMIPVQALIHVVVPSVSGQAVLTMPVFVPLSDLVHLSRTSTVLSYQAGAGLTELLTPTNGALMAVLLAAGVPFGKWVRFASAGALALVAVAVVAICMVR